MCLIVDSSPGCTGLAGKDSASFGEQLASDTCCGSVWEHMGSLGLGWFVLPLVEPKAD